MCLRFVLPTVFFALLTVVRAQFYAPETEFHDTAQRFFPVEAARVLAWQQNTKGGNIGEVAYRVSINPARETVWTIQWLDKSRAAVREKKVTYPESSLLNGPAHYRAVFAQLCGEDWKLEGSTGQADEAFWKGGEAAGVSRPEAIRAANKLIAEKQGITSAYDAAKLAGILLHGILPLYGNALTLDSLLLSRAAAWLCVAEMLGGEAVDSTWAPLMWLAGREKAAAALWKSASRKANPNASSAERFWNFFLGQPSPQDSFLFAARRENRQFAMPLMMYQAGCDLHWAKVVTDVADDVIGEPMAKRHFEYGPTLTIRGSVGGGWKGSGAVLPAIQAWMESLRIFQADPLDFTAYGDALAGADIKDEDQDGFEPVIKKLAPLVNLAFAESSRGVLTPVAHVTTRDLLGYGWESTALQLGYFHNFLRGSLGDPSGAKSIAGPALTHLHGIDPLFASPDATVKYPLSNLARLQLVSSSRVEGVLLSRLPAALTGAPDMWFRRAWLKTGGGNEQLEAMIRAGAPDDAIRKLVMRLLQEGGQHAYNHLLARDRGRKFPDRIDKLGLRATIAAEVPSAVYSRVAMLEAQYAKDGNALRHAQELEKFIWDTGYSFGYSVVFAKYLEANAVQSAKRFYEQIKPFVTDSVGFSNNMGPQRFALAWLENDDKMMRQALADSSTYSHSDLRLRTTYSYVQGETADAARWVDAIIDRYEKEDAREKKLKAFLALLPALANPRHPDHEKALDSFPSSPSWQLLQWIILKDTKLPQEEAVRFLGGEKADPTNRLLIAALRGDKEGFEKIFKEAAPKVSYHARPLIFRLRCDLLGITPPAEQPDLKPADARPLAERVREIAG